MNPPKGTRMMGFGTRDLKEPSTGIRDDIFVRALYAEHAGEEAVLITFDMCFIGREDSDRYKGVLGRLFDLKPRQILLNSSHNHVGPASGTWCYANYLPPDQLYLRQLQRNMVQAVTEAKTSAREAVLYAGAGKSQVPMNRRNPMPDGSIQNRPNPDGIVCDHLPVCVIRDSSGETISVLFSISAHPSIVGGSEISAEYPGVATRKIDAFLGQECSMFLQGCGGDAKCVIAGKARDTWLSGDWSVVDRVGEMLGAEVIELLQSELEECGPGICTALEETFWPLLPVPPREQIEHLAAQRQTAGNPNVDYNYLYLKRHLELLDRGDPIPNEASVLVQGIQLGEGLRLIAIEGEPVAEHGRNILESFPQGITFPLGYANGEAMYLPVTRQLTEGGYEVESFWEYGYPSRLAPGMEKVVGAALDIFKAKGIG